MRSGPLRIGVSACFFHADPKRNIFKGKTLLYLEQSMGNWLMRNGALPVMLPSAAGAFTAAELIETVDGLLLQGGSDMSPTHYGEQPQRPEWEGDYVRDLYEMELIKAAMTADRPVLGICRGLQVINVCLGGSLYQDLQTLHPKRPTHRNWEIYDQLFHDVGLSQGSWLAEVYGDKQNGKVNSVHHQGIKQLGRGLDAEAMGKSDGLIEAIRYRGRGEAKVPFVVGVQWHPEFLLPEDEAVLQPDVLMRAYLNEVRARRGGVAYD